MTSSVDTAVAAAEEEEEPLAAAAARAAAAAWCTPRPLSLRLRSALSSSSSISSSSSSPAEKEFRLPMIVAPLLPPPTPREDITIMAGVDEEEAAVVKRDEVSSFVKSFVMIWSSEGMAIPLPFCLWISLVLMNCQNVRP